MEKILSNFKTEHSLMASIEASNPSSSGGSSGSSRIAGMAACIDDVVDAVILDSQSSQRTMIVNYYQLLRVLNFCKDALPIEYQNSYADPFITAIQNLGSNQFHQIMQGTSRRDQNLRALIHDITDSIIQYYQEYKEEASDAFREVTSDLYEAFLTASQRRSGETGIHIKPPEHGILPPMIKWGNPDNGPYTYTGPATSIFNAGPALVNLPPANSEKGLVAWSALGHETGGHDIIHADEGLEIELGQKVYSSVYAQSNNRAIAQYWSNCVDEAASDVLGLLNLGPAAGIGLIAYFRGLQKAYTGITNLRNEGPFNGPHPIDILRGFIAARTIELLDGFDSNLRTVWADIIRKEAKADLQARGGYFVIDGYQIRADVMIESAEKAAETIALSPLNSLEGHSLSEIITWTDDDERITNILRPIIRQHIVPRAIQEGQYAAHTVAAATLEALSSGNDIQGIFDTMRGILANMHTTNQTWTSASHFAPRHIYPITRAEIKEHSNLDLKKEFEGVEAV